MERAAPTTAFAEHVYEDGYGLGVENHFWHYARNRFVEAAVRKVAGKGDRILDVGCGVGMTVSHLRRAGFDCHGVELANAPVRPDVRAVVKTGIPATLLPDAERELVKVILLLDVIEHIESPDDFLEGLRKAFPCLKSIIFTVPARQELWSNFDVAAGHFLRYDNASLSALAQRNSLKLKTKRHLFRVLYPVMYLATKKPQGRATTVHPPKGASAVIHRLAAWTFMAEASLPLPTPGTSILAVCNL